jgi:hypothetical protein
VDEPVRLCGRPGRPGGSPTGSGYRLRPIIGQNCDPGVVPSNPKAWGSTAQWRHIRRQVLERDGWLCQLRGPGCTGRATEVHHLYGRLRPGSPLGPADYDVTLLAAACRDCNRRVGAVRSDPPSRGRTRW